MLITIIYKNSSLPYFVTIVQFSVNRLNFMSPRVIIPVTMNKTKCFFLKDSRLFKLIFAILTSYLIGMEFYTYYVLKPTYTSSSENNIGQWVELLKI